MFKKLIKPVQSAFEDPYFSLKDILMKQNWSELPSGESELRYKFQVGISCVTTFLLENMLTLLKNGEANPIEIARNRLG